MNQQPDQDTEPAVDMSRFASLEGAFAVAVCVDTNGDESFWVLSTDGGTEHGCNCAQCAPHEQVGAYVPPKRRPRVARQDDHPS